MTPDEHAAEAEQILTDETDADLVALARAQVHALLATRPTETALTVVGTNRWVDAPYPAELTDRPTRPLTVVDYDKAMDRAFTALWDALEPDMPNRPSPQTVLGWAKAAVDAFSDPNPTTETRHGR